MGASARPPDHEMRKTGAATPVSQHFFNPNSKTDDSSERRNSQAAWLARRHLIRLPVALQLAALVFEGGGR